MPSTKNYDDIDERVLSMQFDNNDFEKSAGQSISTLDKLKAALKFDKNAGNTAEVQRSFIDLGGTVELVGSKFSALEVIGITALQNITNKGVNYLESTLKSISVDQISAGWDKYADKTTAVQTIMSATGDSMEYVSDQLAILNRFTDETSYNFVDMVSNIGKFTAQQVPLEDAVTAMQGIATATALAGQNSAAASRAMYNFAQSLGVGSVKLMDWRSIENANIATAEFKQTIMDTAVELGMLRKEGDQYYSNVDESEEEVAAQTVKTKKVLDVTKNAYIEVAETASGVARSISKSEDSAEVSIGNFSSTLSKGWFTADVLIETLRKYGSTATDVIEYADENGILVSEAFEEMGLDMSSLGVRAFKAAQEAKTFRDALDSVKDATSTGWMNIFEKLFGNYEEAKVVWTDLANTLYDIFAGPLEEVNDILDTWKILGGQTKFIDSFKQGYRILSEIAGVIKKAWESVMPTLNSDRLMEFTDAIHKMLSETSLSNKAVSVLGTAFRNLFRILKAIGTLYKTVFKAGLKAARPLLDLLGSAVSRITYFISRVLNLAKSTGLFQTILDDIRIIGDKLSESFSKVFGKRANGEAKDYSETIRKVRDKFKEIVDKIKLTEENSGFLSIAFDGLFTAVSKIAGVVQTIYDIGKDILEKVVNKIFGLVDPDNLTSDWDSFKQKLVEIKDKIAAAAEALVLYKNNTEGATQAMYNIDVERATRWIETFRENHPLISSVLDDLKAAAERIKEIGNQIIDWGLDRLDEITFANLFKVLGLLLGFKIAGGVFDAISAIAAMLGSVAKIFNKSMIEVAGEAVRDIGIGLLAIAAGIWLIGDVDASKLDKAVNTLEVFFGFIALFVGVIGAIFALIDALKSKWASKNSGGDEKKTGLIGKIKGAIFGDSSSDESSSLEGAAKMIQSIGVSIALIAASVWLLMKPLEEGHYKNFDVVTEFLAGVMVGIGVFLAEAAVIAGVSKQGTTAFAGLGIAFYFMGGVIKKIADSVIKMAKLNPEQVDNLLLAAESLFVAMSGFMIVVLAAGATKLTKDAAKGAAAIGVTMLAVSVALAVINQVVSKENWGWIAVGIGLAALAVMSLLVLFKLFDSGVNFTSALAVSIGLVAMAASMWLMAEALKGLDKVQISGSTLGALAIVMGVILVMGIISAVAPQAGVAIIAALGGVAIALVALGAAVWLITNGISALVNTLAQVSERADPEKIVSVLAAVGSGLVKVSGGLVLVGLALIPLGIGLIEVGAAVLLFGIGFGIAALGVAALISAFSGLLETLDGVGEGISGWATGIIDIFAGLVNGIKKVANGIGKAVDWVKGIFTGEKETTEELTDADLGLLEAERKRQTLGPKAIALNEKLAKSTKAANAETKEAAKITEKAAHEQKTYEEFIAMTSDEQKKYLETASDEEIKALDSMAKAEEEEAEKGSAVNTLLGIFGLSGTEDATNVGAESGASFFDGFGGMAAEMAGTFDIKETFGGLTGMQTDGADSGEAFGGGFVNSAKAKIDDFVHGDFVHSIGTGLLEGTGIADIGNAITGYINGDTVTTLAPTVEQTMNVVNDTTVNHEVSGTITVEGVNDEDELVATEELIVDQMIKDNRRTTRMVTA